MKNIFLFLIKVYQKTISPDHGVLKDYPSHYKCRFYPSCSAYCYTAIEKYGSKKGSLMCLKRIKRCSPKNDGGYDPVK